MKFLLGASILVAVASAWSAPQDLAPRAAVKCSPGRVVAISIDNGGNRFAVDEQDRRLKATRAIVQRFTPIAEAGEGNKADKVALVGGRYDRGTVDFPMGDPSAPFFTALDNMYAEVLRDNEWGVRTALDQVKAANPARGHGAIIFLCDADDYKLATKVPALIREAADAGIRVHFGQLASKPVSEGNIKGANGANFIYGIAKSVFWPSLGELTQEFHDAIRASGGTITVISNDEQQQAFVDNIFNVGVTNTDVQCDKVPVPSSSPAPVPSSSPAPIPSSSAAPSPSSSAAPVPSSSAAPSPSSSAAPSPSSSAAPSPSSSAAPAPSSSECPAASASTVIATVVQTTTVTAPTPSSTGNVCLCKCDAPDAKPLPKFEL